MKKHKEDPENEGKDPDWKLVAEAIGYGRTDVQCHQATSSGSRAKDISRAEPRTCSYNAYRLSLSSRVSFLSEIETCVAHLRVASCGFRASARKGMMPVSVKKAGATVATDNIPTAYRSS